MLDPAKVATEGLSASSINLLIGEGILKFLLLETKSAKDQHQNSFLAKNFFDSLEKRFQNRRDAVLNTLILYLSNRDIFKSEHPLQLTTKAAAVKYGIEMMKRLFKDEVAAGQHRVIQEKQGDPANIQDRLKMSIGSVQDGNSQRLSEAADPYKKMFDLYDRQGTRSLGLNRLFNALLSIQPTSTQSERNFSLAAAVATPHRSRMSSEKLNALCFLKSFFKGQC